MVYGVHHEIFGDIGEHRVSFSKSGEDLIVDIDNSVAVKLWVMTAFRFKARRREVWRGDRLVAYWSHTNDDGRDYRVTAKVEGQELLIDGPGGHGFAPAGTFPTHPWNKAILNQSLLMDSKSGQLLRLTIRPAGKETLEAGGCRIEAEKFEVRGDQERELWFDAEDNWVQLRFLKDGKAVTFTLKEWVAK